MEAEGENLLLAATWTDLESIIAVEISSMQKESKNL